MTVFGGIVTSLVKCIDSSTTRFIILVQPSQNIEMAVFDASVVCIFSDLRHGPHTIVFHPSQNVQMSLFGGYRNKCCISHKTSLFVEHLQCVKIPCVDGSVIHCEVPRTTVFFQPFKYVIIFVRICLFTDTNVPRTADLF